MSKLEPEDLYKFNKNSLFNEKDKRRVKYRQVKRNANVTAKSNNVTSLTGTDSDVLRPVYVAVNKVDPICNVISVNVICEESGHLTFFQIVVIFNSHN